jgi:pimeloyl-ACP methyl ester carboxylesterase
LFSLDRSQYVRGRWAIAIGYVILLILSHLTQHSAGARARPLSELGVAGRVGVGAGVRKIEVPAFSDRGPIEGRSLEIAIHRWPEDDESWARADASRPPVVLIHGSPGDGAGFRALGALLGAHGYRVVAPDLPGFGESTRSAPSHSILADACVVGAMLDEQKIARAHIVGWSNGGGVGMYLADLAPHRVASLTLLASIGAQEFEGSGSYVFEHFKYAMGFAIVGGVPELVPHFGALGTFEGRTGWLRQFWDSDQRPLRGVMERLTTPTLILHGESDPLVPAYAAEEHHKIIRTSSLVMVDGNHFLPMTQPDVVAAHLVPFLSRHDKPGIEPVTTASDLAPRREPHGIYKWLEGTEVVARVSPWWVEILIVAAMTLISPGWTIVLMGLLIIGIDLDIVVVITGVVSGFMGRAVVEMLRGLSVRARHTQDEVIRFPGARRRAVSVGDWSRRLRTRPIRAGFDSQFVGRERYSAAFGAGLGAASAWSRAGFLLGRFAAVLLFTIVGVVAVVGSEAVIVGPVFGKLGVLGVAYTLIKLIILADVAPLIVSRRGRQHLAALIGRLIHHEYWPTAVLYAPVVAWAIFTARRHGGLMTPSCCNPEIPGGGGMAGESKSQIMNLLRAGSAEAERGGARVLPAFIIAPNESVDRRMAELTDLMAREASVREFPVVMKPDKGERGFAVKVIRSEDDARRYLEAMPGAAIVQEFHAGPQECGVLWMRTPGGGGGEGGVGRIFSITRKEFPILIADGQRTLEDQILAHPRFRRQAHVFLERFAADASSIFPAGERIRLAQSGNHIQGTLFRDGADLITPELERAIDTIAAGFPRLDIGRFDIRFESEELLKQGLGFAILEMNGTASESTNIYDPAHHLLWAYRILFAQWRRMYALGAERRTQGVKPMTVRSLIRETRAHFRSLKGPSVAD